MTLTAEYGDTYQLWVGGVQVTDANRNDVLGDGKVSFDPENCVLNLDGVTMLPGINSNLRSMIYANRMNLTVTGSGELTSGQMFSNGIYVNLGSLTLNGDFSVTGSQGNAFTARSTEISASPVHRATRLPPRRIYLSKEARSPRRRKAMVSTPADGCIFTTVSRASLPMQNSRGRCIMTISLSIPRCS